VVTGTPQVQWRTMNLPDPNAECLRSVEAEYLTPYFRPLSDIKGGMMAVFVPQGEATRPWGKL
jgi:hypothetical protein